MLTKHQNQKPKIQVHEPVIDCLAQFVPNMKQKNIAQS